MTYGNHSWMQSSVTLCVPVDCTVLRSLVWVCCAPTKKTHLTFNLYMKHETDTAMQLSPSQAKHTPAECIDITYLLMCACVCVCVELLLTELGKCVCLWVCVRVTGLLTFLSKSSLVRLVKSSSLYGPTHLVLFWPSPPHDGLSNHANTQPARKHTQTYIETPNAGAHDTNTHTHTAKYHNQTNDLRHGNTQQHQALGSNWV